MVQEEQKLSLPLADRLGACPCCHSSHLSTIKAPSINIGAEHFAPLSEELGMSKCRSCRLAFINPRPSERMLVAFYNRDGYDCHNYDFEAGIAASGESARLTLIEGMVPKNSLLDFGAGAGHLLRAAHKRRWGRVAGIELGKRARQNLKDVGFEMYEDLSSWQAGGSKAEVVTMVHVLEHLTDPSTALNGIHDALLKSSGIFYVEVPNADSLRARLALSPLQPLWTAKTERYLAFPIHLLYFNPQSLRRFLQQHGFSVLKMGTLGLGVEELFAAPPQPPHSMDAPSTQQESEALPGAHKNLRIPAFIKGAVKSAMSSSLLGENLYAICKAS